MVETRYLFISNKTNKKRTYSIAHGFSILTDNIVYYINLNNKLIIEPWLVNSEFSEIQKLFEIISITDNFYQILLPKINANFENLADLYSQLITKIIAHYKINIVYNSSFDLFSISTIIIDKIFYIYDICDDYLAMEGTATQRAYINHFIETELYKANLITTSSFTIQKIYQRKYWKNIVVVPNGAIKNNCAAEEISNFEIAFRKKYNISNHTKIITALDMPAFGEDYEIVKSAITILKQQFDIDLILIYIKNNESESINNYNYKTAIGIDITDDIELSKLYCISALGVLPLKKNNYTEHSIPTSVLKYGFAKKHLVSTAIEEMQLYNLPHIIYTTDKLQNWITAIGWALKSNWDDSWTKELDRYEWKKICAIFERIILNCLRARNANN